MQLFAILTGANMPIYAYFCQDCGPFEKQRPMAEFQQPAICPTCQLSAPRMVTAVRLNLMPGNSRIAHTRNEKSANEPRVAQSHCHHHAGHDKEGKHQHNHAHHHKAQVSSRPWQVGH